MSTTRDSASFFSQSTAVVFANIISAMLAIGYVALISRHLGPAGYGSVTAAISLGNVLLLPLGPLSGTLTKFAAGYHGSGDRGRLATLLFSSLRLLTMIAVPTFFLLLLAAPWLEKLLRIEGIPTLIAWELFVILTVFLAFARSALSGEQRFVAYGANQVAEAVARLIAGTAIVLLGAGAAGGVGGYALGIGVALILGLVQMKHLWNEPRAPIDLHEIVSFSVPVVVVYAYFIAATNLDMLVAKRALSAADAGLYGAASGLARMLFMVGSPIYIVLFARVSSSKKELGAGLLSLRVLGLMAIGLAISLVVPICFGELALTLLFGAKFVGALPALRILWIAFSLLVLQMAATHYLFAVERMRSAALFLAPCALLFFLLWRSHDTATAIASATLIATACGFVITAILVAIDFGQRSKCASS